ncbi:MAG TPA: methyltransferase domain-containing protein [Anaerolineales bacterium]|nr:methyltransferase domain-containing protein [Anaerolineales bacterium]
MKPLLRFFFRLLYHQFAWTYDLVAALVSFNRWKDWVLNVIPFLEGSRVLEIGHGPGHLQRALRRQGTLAVGIDASPQMGRLAKRNLQRDLQPQNTAYTQINLTQGLAQALPFRAECFDTIVATFPTEYFMDPRTLADVKRCLVPGGRFVVLPVALPKNRLLDWLFKATQQRPAEALDVIRTRLEGSFTSAGFQTEIQALVVPSGILVVVIAVKPAL